MTDLVACHQCDMLFHRDDIPSGARADCTRCGAELYRNIPKSLDRSLALYVSALIFMIIANFYPFITMQTSGIKATSLVFSGGLKLYEFGMEELGLLVFLTSILFPFICVTGMIYLLVPARFGHLPPFYGPVYRAVRFFEPWSLLSVFMLGTLIAIVKLQSLATVIPGLGMAGFVLMLITFSAARASFDPQVLWQNCRVKQLDHQEVNATEKVVTCHTCGLLRPDRPDLHHCERCSDRMHHRKTHSAAKDLGLSYGGRGHAGARQYLPGDDGQEPWAGFSGHHFEWGHEAHVRRHVHPGVYCVVCFYCGAAPEVNSAELSVVFC